MVETPHWFAPVGRFSCDLSCNLSIDHYYTPTMTILFNQILNWAKLMPPIGISPSGKLAWRNFVPVELNGVRLALPAKTALAWMESTGAKSIELTPQVERWFMRGQMNGSKITLRAYTSSIPCEEPYNARIACYGGGNPISERCEWTDMTVDGVTTSTADERKEAARVKRLEKAKADYAKAKKELDKREKEANEARETLAQPLAEAVRDAKTYLTALRARRAYENDPTIFPSWMPETCMRREFDLEAQASVDREHKTRALYDDLLGELNTAIAERDAYKTKDGRPRLGPKRDRLNQAIQDKRRELIRFIEGQFAEYIRAQNWPENLRWGWLVRPYSRARLTLSKWENEKEELKSRVTEARARLDKAESGWQYWQKDKLASWIHEGDEEKLTKARAMGASCQVI